MTRLISFIAATLVVVSSFIVYGGTAAAHERRMVGPYQFVFGWLNEPAYVGLMNSLDMRISDTRVTPARNVEGLEKTLTIDLQTGGLAPLKLTVAARFGTPGAYNGYVTPTATGAYVFHIKGKVEDLTVDEVFESGPGRFGDIESATALQYPTKVPSGDDLAQRLADIQDSIQQLRILGTVALVVGLIAFVRAVTGRTRPF